MDFRGPQGNMCVGNAYTLCHGEQITKPHKSADMTTMHNGPFKVLNMELGIRYGEIRMRLKLDYRIKDKRSLNLFSKSPPKLFLASITVARERLGQWPTKKEKAFYGPSGAPGGLFDPPPVGGDEQSSKYMQVDLEGYATALFPFVLDQADVVDESSWVVSLDWTPGKMRYQCDRKFLGGKQIKGLKTLELCEVAADQAQDYRPGGGPENMRQ